MDFVHRRSTNCEGWMARELMIDDVVPGCMLCRNFVTKKAGASEEMGDGVQNLNGY